MSVIRSPDFSVCERCTVVRKWSSTEACTECGHFDVTLTAASVLPDHVWDAQPTTFFRELLSASLFVADEEYGLPNSFDLYISLDDGRSEYCAARSRNVSLENAAGQLVSDILANQRLMDKKSLLPLVMRPSPWNDVARDGTVYVRATAKYGPSSKQCSYLVTGNNPFDWQWQLEHDRLMFLKEKLRQDGVPKKMIPTGIQGVYHLPGEDVVFIPDPL